LSSDTISPYPELRASEFAEDFNGQEKEQDGSTDLPPGAIGADLAKMLAAKKKLIENGIKTGDPESARRVLDDVGTFFRCLQEGPEIQLREGRLKDMSPENAQAAIYAIQIFEDSLRSDPEIRH
jgi:hypothetical protein